ENKMGEQAGFDFHAFPGFHSPQAALLHKARYVEGNEQQLESLEPCDFVFPNGECDESSVTDQNMVMSYSPSPATSFVTGSTQPPVHPTP
ncbi:hypothetical protein KI387_003377, partial [Taxus chinensis]